MWALLGSLLLVGAAPTEAAPTEVAVAGRAQQKFQIKVHIVELKPIKGLTKKDANSKDHLHIKPVLTVTPADVTSVQKRRLRGPIIGTKKTGFTHYPSLVVDLQLTQEAKLRLKTAVLKARSATTRTPLVATVVNDHHDGAWTKFVLDDPTSLVYWNKFGCRISCTGDEEKADALIKYFTQTQTNR